MQLRSSYCLKRCTASPREVFWAAGRFAVEARGISEHLAWSPSASSRVLSSVGLMPPPLCKHRPQTRTGNTRHQQMPNNRQGMKGPPPSFISEDESCCHTRLTANSTSRKEKSRTSEEQLNTQQLFSDEYLFKELVLTIGDPRCQREGNRGGDVAITECTPTYLPWMVFKSACNLTIRTSETHRYVSPTTSSSPSRALW